MTRSRFDRTTCYVSVKHTSTNADDPVAILDDLNLAVTDPMSKRPRPDAKVFGSLHDSEKFVGIHERFLR
jgi:hypothetical protein